MTKSNDRDAKIKKILYNEVSLVVGAVALISSCIFWVQNPQNEMELQLVKLQSQVENNQSVVHELDKLKNNDFVEIHKALEQIQTREIDIMKALARLEAIHEH